MYTTYCSVRAHAVLLPAASSVPLGGRNVSSGARPRARGGVRVGAQAWRLKYYTVSAAGRLLPTAIFQGSRRISWPRILYAPPLHPQKARKVTPSSFAARRRRRRPDAAAPIPGGGDAERAWSTRDPHRNINPITTIVPLSLLCVHVERQWRIRGGGRGNGRGNWIPPGKFQEKFHECSLKICIVFVVGQNQ